jgi:ribosomal protein L29
MIKTKNQAKVKDKKSKSLTLIEIKLKKKILLQSRIKNSSGESVSRTYVRNIKKEIARLFTTINIG